jgi:ABC-2 type transport system ATP-binding protein
MERVVETKGLCKNYGEIKAVDSLGFSIKKGEIFTIIGPNGAGKSTLLKIIIGIVDKSSGVVSILGMDPDKERLRINKAIGYMPEENALYENLSVRHYLRFFSELYSIPKKEADRRAEEMCRDLGVRDINQKIGNLSKGNKRKVLLMRALMHKPRLLILDEPTSGLDPVTTSVFLGFIRKLRQEGKTIIFSAHNLYQVEEISDRVLILKDGKELICDTIPNIKKRARYKGYKLDFIYNKKKHHREFSDKQQMIDYINQIDTAMIKNIDAEQISLQKLFITEFSKEDE